MKLQTFNQNLHELEKQIDNNKIDNQLSMLVLSDTEKLIKSNSRNSTSKDSISEFLRLTSKSNYLLSLPGYEERVKWIEIVFKAIQTFDYSLLDLFTSKVKEHPKKTLFNDLSNQEPQWWTYEQIFRHCREIAATFLIKANNNPRVAIFSDNSVESACCDLACLSYDILVTPLNVHFNEEILIYIFDILSINIVVTDSLDRLFKLEQISKKTQIPFQIILLRQVINIESRKIFYLNEYCKQLNNEEIERILSKRKRFYLNEVSTVMFTSGSTGKPKGVSFSIYNIVSKRFARGAALPEVGNNEVLLCYLPLYHTFGRYLELIGMIYWSGTYIFPENQSSDTILSLFPKVNPTGFISIPLRWIQLYEKCIEALSVSDVSKDDKKIIEGITGHSLRWGLSAAGYLSPKVFRFFQNNNINLCSGFGMTEATGGVTMTPPGNYVENSTGILLPGLNSKINQNGELEISGHYIARYLDDKKPGDIIPYPDEDDYWMPTGDIFNIRDGFYEIVDRIKDIYKNNRGQTIAPLKVEMKFSGVPGIKRTFLAGDGRAYNVLFIIPDKEDLIIQSINSLESQREYYHQIVTSANQDLAPFERIVNFAILDRDFQLEQGELTPKGSYNRKKIEINFSNIIDELYKSDCIELKFDKDIIKIPRWFFRDLGIIEDDIIIDSNGLLNTHTNKRLTIKRNPDNSNIIIGDLEYCISGNKIDMGLFAHQPKLWVANPSLIDFAPCKEGWDLPLNSITPQIYRPWIVQKLYNNYELPKLNLIKNQELVNINNNLTLALFGEGNNVIDAINEISKIGFESGQRIGDLVRTRLEALSRHPSEKIRCLAYRILLMDDPNLNYGEVFPAFVLSGLTFLNEESIEEITQTNLEKRRLEALRQRLYMYRIQLTWPGNHITRLQFERIFNMLVKFAKKHREFYSSVRAELSSWILHKSDSILAEKAEQYFKKLYISYEKKLAKEIKIHSESEWLSKVIFDDSITPDEIIRLKKVLFNTTFLKQSIMLTYDELDFSLSSIVLNGIWISPLHSQYYFKCYRLTANTVTGKHYDLQIILYDNINEETVKNTIYWLASVAGYPYYPRVLPRIGCARPELNAMSLVYIGELTVWEKIREFAGARIPEESFQITNNWRKLYIQGIAAFFRGWRNSGFRIIPGSVSPVNVVVPELDFHEGATILSLNEWKEYKNTLDLILPIIKNFYKKAFTHYPWCKNQLDYCWIFDSVLESLGETEGISYLEQLLNDLQNDIKEDLELYSFRMLLTNYMVKRKKNYYPSISLQNAIDRYKNWKSLNQFATPIAKEQTIAELYHLYRLYNCPEIARYYLYRHTYFSDQNENVKTAFDLLINAMFVNPKKHATQMSELSDLQDTLFDFEDRNVFSRMVFPKLQQSTRLDIYKFGESEKKQVVVYSYISDKFGQAYTFRKPVKPTEIGQLYRLFYIEKYNISISTQDRYYILTDKHERIVGGICYKIMDNNVVLIDGIVVVSQLQGRNLGSAMLKDFFVRMQEKGIEVVKTHFYFVEFFLNLGFKVNKRWGALVKFLTMENNLDEENSKYVIK